TFDYRFTPPDSGFYWYHPQVLPFFGEQLARGLYGAMIIDEPEPPVADRDMLVILGDWDLDGKGQIKEFATQAPAIRADTTNRNSRREERLAPAADNEDWYKPLVTVNARAVPVEEVLSPSSRLRLRIVNACPKHMVIVFAGLAPMVLAIDSQP